MRFSDILEKARGKEDEAWELLTEMVSFPSVATRDYRGIEDCANMLENRFKQTGYDILRFSESGPPVIYAEKNVGAKKTVMFYHHYDVQPEGDLSLWKSSPWKLTVKGDRAYGRGLADDKGPLVASMIGIELAEKLVPKLPVNVKFVVEGEEESTPNNLPKFAQAHPELLKADGCIWEGGSALGGSPAVIVCGMKGDAYFELRAGGNPNFPAVDVHSGEANAVPNPAWRLVWALNTLKDKNENILIEGFNEEVVEPTQEEMAAMMDHGEDLDGLIKKEHGLDKLLMDRRGEELVRWLYFKPTVTISGLTSGAQTSEDVTIIPSKASAKVDIRLVPNLTMDKAEKLVKAHIKKHGIEGVEVEFKSGYDPAKTPLDDPFITMLKTLSAEAVAPAYVRVIPMIGSSGPVAFFTPHTPICMTYSHAEVDGTNSHAPNENMLVASMRQGIAYCAATALRLGEKK